MDDAAAAINLVGSVVKLVPAIKNATRSVSERERRAYETVNIVLRTLGSRIGEAGLVSAPALARALTEATMSIDVKLFSVETNRLFESLASKLNDPILVNSVFASIYLISFLTAELQGSLPNYKDTYTPLGPRLVEQLFMAAIGQDGFRENQTANLDAYRTLARTAGLLRSTDLERATFPGFPSFRPCRYSSKSFKDTRNNRAAYDKLVKHFDTYGFPQPLNRRDVGEIRDWRFLSGDANTRAFEVERADKHIGENFGRVLHWLICSADRMPPGEAVIAYLDQHIELIKWMRSKMRYRALQAATDLEMEGPHAMMKKDLRQIFDTWVVLVPSETTKANRPASSAQWLKRPTGEGVPRTPSIAQPTHSVGGMIPPMSNMSFERPPPLTQPVASNFAPIPSVRTGSLSSGQVPVLSDGTAPAIPQLARPTTTPAATTASVTMLVLPLSQGSSPIRAPPTLSMTNTISQDLGSPAGRPAIQIPSTTPDKSSSTATYTASPETSRPPMSPQAALPTVSPPPYSPESKTPVSAFPFPGSRPRSVVRRKAPPRPKKKPILAKALDDFEPEEGNDEELPFKEGDILEIVERSATLEEEGWCRARLKEGKRIGLAPLEYLEELPIDAQRPSQAQPALGTVSEISASEAVNVSQASVAETTQLYELSSASPQPSNATDVEASRMSPRLNPLGFQLLPLQGSLYTGSSPNMVAQGLPSQLNTEASPDGHYSTNEGGSQNPQTSSHNYPSQIPSSGVSSTSHSISTFGRGAPSHTIAPAGGSPTIPNQIHHPQSGSPAQSHAAIGSPDPGSSNGSVLSVAGGLGGAAASHASSPQNAGYSPQGNVPYAGSQPVHLPIVGNSQNSHNFAPTHPLSSPSQTGNVNSLSGPPSSTVKPPNLRPHATGRPPLQPISSQPSSQSNHNTMPILSGVLRNALSSPSKQSTASGQRFNMPNQTTNSSMNAPYMNAPQSFGIPYGGPSIPQSKPAYPSAIPMDGFPMRPPVMYGAQWNDTNNDVMLQMLAMQAAANMSQPSTAPAPAAAPTTAPPVADTSSYNNLVGTDSGLDQSGTPSTGFGTQQAVYTRYTDPATDPSYPSYSTEKISKSLNVYDGSDGLQVNQVSYDTRYSGRQSWSDGPNSWPIPLDTRDIGGDTLPQYQRYRSSKRNRNSASSPIGTGPGVTRTDSEASKKISQASLETLILPSPTLASEEMDHPQSKKDIEQLVSPDSELCPALQLKVIATEREQTVFEKTLFGDSAVLCEARCSQVEYTVPDEENPPDLKMVQGSAECRLFLVTKRHKLPSGILRFTTSIWALSDDRSVRMQQELPDGEEVIPYTVWGNLKKICIRVPTELRFHDTVYDAKHINIAKTSWVNYILEIEIYASAFQSALMGKALLLSLKTNKTMRLHDGLIADTFSYAEQMCALENLRIWQDHKTNGVIAMIHYSAHFRDGYMAFYLNSSRDPIRVRDEGGKVVKVKGLRLEVGPKNSRSRTNRKSPPIKQKGDKNTQIRAVKIEFTSEEHKRLFVDKVREVQGTFYAG